MSWQLVAQGDGSNFTEDIMNQYGNQFGPKQNGRFEIKFADTPGITDVAKYINDNISSGVNSVSSQLIDDKTVQMDFTQSNNVALPAILVTIFLWLSRLPWGTIFARVFPYFRALLPWIAGWFIWKWIEEKAPTIVPKAVDKSIEIIKENAPFFIGLSVLGLYFLLSGNKSSTGSGSAQTIIVER